MAPIIVLKDVSFSYGSEDVLQNVDLTVESGEFASIVGPNGGGKTTLVRLILGLLKPKTGTVSLFGGQPEINRLRVGYTPQYAPVDLKFPITVLDVVLLGRLGLAAQKKSFPWNLLPIRYSKEDREAAQDAIQILHLDGLEKTPFGDLSGGQKQRALIARALCQRPDLLILDEPTNNIDPSGMKIFYQLLCELNRKVSILIVSHDLGVVSQYVKSVICVSRRVVVHPTSNLNGTVIRDIYGSDIQLVRHDHRCSEHGHQSNSDL